MDSEDSGSEEDPVVRSDRLRKAFVAFDKNNSGSLTIAELAEVLKRPGGDCSPMPEQDVQQLVTLFDKNKDGLIQIEEFVVMISGLEDMQGGIIDARSFLLQKFVRYHFSCVEAAAKQMRVTSHPRPLYRRDDHANRWLCDGLCNGCERRTKASVGQPYYGVRWEDKGAPASSAAHEGFAGYDLCGVCARQLQLPADKELAMTGAPTAEKAVEALRSLGADGETGPGALLGALRPALTGGGAHLFGQEEVNELASLCGSLARNPAADFVAQLTRPPYVYTPAEDGMILPPAGWKEIQLTALNVSMWAPDDATVSESRGGLRCMIRSAALGAASVSELDGTLADRQRAADAWMRVRSTAHGFQGWQLDDGYVFGARTGEAGAVSYWVEGVVCPAQRAASGGRVEVSVSASCEDAEQQKAALRFAMGVNVIV